MKHLTAILACTVSAIKAQQDEFCGNEWSYDPCFDQMHQRSCDTERVASYGTKGWNYYDAESGLEYFVHTQDWYGHCMGCDLRWKWDDCH